MCAHKLAQTVCKLYDEHMQFPSLLYFKTALYGWNYKTVHALLKWEKNGLILAQLNIEWKTSIFLVSVKNRTLNSWGKSRANHLFRCFKILDSIMLSVYRMFYSEKHKNIYCITFFYVYRQSVVDMRMLKLERRFRRFKLFLIDLHWTRHIERFESIMIKKKNNNKLLRIEEAQNKKQPDLEQCWKTLKTVFGIISNLQTRTTNVWPQIKAESVAAVSN